jgi:hypothetical protein
MTHATRLLALLLVAACGGAGDPDDSSEDGSGEVEGWPEGGTADTESLAYPCDYDERWWWDEDEGLAVPMPYVDDVDLWTAAALYEKDGQYTGFDLSGSFIGAQTYDGDHLQLCWGGQPYDQGLIYQTASGYQIDGATDGEYVVDGECRAYFVDLCDGLRDEYWSSGDRFPVVTLTLWRGVE